jgi:hypothetical protein
MKTICKTAGIPTRIEGMNEKAARSHLSFLIIRASREVSKF